MDDIKHERLAHKLFSELDALGAPMTQSESADAELVSIDRAIALEPENAELLMNRGTALHKLGRLNEAVKSFNQAIAFRPDLASAYRCRGHAFKDLARLDEALSSYDKALAIHSDHAQVWKDRGTVLLQLSRLEEAIESLDRAIALKPNFAEAFNNRGTALHYLKRLDEAVASFDRAIEIKTDFTNAIFNRGLSRLLGGNFRQGWPDYEWRWKSRGFPEVPRTIRGKIWQGENLAGRSIAIHALEQGLGDVIQFARYLPLLVEQKAKVTFVAPANLARLLRPLTSGTEVVTSMDNVRDFDFHCPLMSLPFKFRTEFSSIPNHVPYLGAERDLAVRWKKQLGDHGFKIGICWQIGPGNDWGRSIPLGEFASVSRMPNVRLISLQKNHGLDKLPSLPSSMHVECLGDQFDGGPDGFIDTAAVIANLDLVLTADTSIAHVAGALGRPTWVGLKYVPDWRWLLDRKECPWYPTIRLFRQETDGDWKSVFSRIETELRLVCR